MDVKQHGLDLHAVMVHVVCTIMTNQSFLRKTLKGITSVSQFHFALHCYYCIVL